MMYKDKQSYERQWMGTWWKPWTWFRWKTMLFLTDMEFRESSFRGLPANEDALWGDRHDKA